MAVAGCEGRGFIGASSLYVGPYGGIWEGDRIVYNIGCDSCQQVRLDLLVNLNDHCLGAMPFRNSPATTFVTL